eukprot:3899834-Rhodomonas_salina.3
MASKILETRASSGWDGLYFGGTAFKNPKNHVKLCRVRAQIRLKQPESRLRGGQSCYEGVEAVDDCPVAVPVEASASVAATAAGYMDVVRAALSATRASGTDVGMVVRSARLCAAVCGTEVGYAARRCVVLRSGMLLGGAGTEVGYGGTR